MIITKLFFTLSAIVIICAGSVLADNSCRIYGTITTVDGDELVGCIRWDKNEGCWTDLLDGTKEISSRAADKVSRKKNRRSSIKIFGIKIGGDHSFSYGSSAQSGIRFGHIERLEPRGNDEVLLTLKSGETIELRNGSTDIGDFVVLAAQVGVVGNISIGDRAVVAGKAAVRQSLAGGKVFPHMRVPGRFRYSTSAAPVAAPRARLAGLLLRIRRVSTAQREWLRGGYDPLRLGT